MKKLIVLTVLVSALTAPTASNGSCPNGPRFLSPVNGHYGWTYLGPGKADPTLPWVRERASDFCEARLRYECETGSRAPGLPFPSGGHGDKLKCPVNRLDPGTGLFRVEYERFESYQFQGLGPGGPPGTGPLEDLIRDIPVLGNLLGRTFTVRCRGICVTQCQSECDHCDEAACQQQWEDLDQCNYCEDVEAGCFMEAKFDDSQCCPMTFDECEATCQECVLASDACWHCKESLPPSNPGEGDPGGRPPDPGAGPPPIPPTGPDAGNCPIGAPCRRSDGSRGTFNSNCDCESVEVTEGFPNGGNCSDIHVSHPSECPYECYNACTQAY